MKNYLTAQNYPYTSMNILTKSTEKESQHGTRLPLTEKNLEIHTKQFPACKDARRRNAKLFVKNQQPYVAMELQLMEERAKEISALIENNTNNSIHSTMKSQKWYHRLGLWIKSDKIKRLSKRSTMIDDTSPCDSGIASMNSSNSKLSKLSSRPSLPIHRKKFLALRYSEMAIAPS
ncbi:hypothetical protein BDB01DRAFT_852499 [Pilobolus umbonatus]|nr:hypothetical protein BDB01DRAFT_852499 [Pilobolus umbonatus]